MLVPQVVRSRCGVLRRSPEPAILPANAGANVATLGQLRDSRPVTEEELAEYVDGHLADERRVVVERYLRNFPGIADQIAADCAQREALRAAFDARANEPLPPNLNLSTLMEQQLTRRPRAWRWVLYVGAGVGLVSALGVLVHRRSGGRP